MKTMIYVYLCIHDFFLFFQPTRACIHEIRRVMRERGTKIELLPDVEDNCIADLSQFCSDNDEHAEKGAVSFIEMLLSFFAMDRWQGNRLKKHAGQKHECVIKATD